MVKVFLEFRKDLSKAKREAKKAQLIAPLSTMPSWDDAPPWANYLAMDSQQRWTWFEKRPYRVNSIGDWGTCGLWEPAKLIPHPNWHLTLQKRPSGASK